MTDLELEKKIKKNGETVQVDASAFYDLMNEMSSIIQTIESKCFVQTVSEEDEKAGAGLQRSIDIVSEFVSFYLRTQEHIDEI